MNVVSVRFDSYLHDGWVTGFGGEVVGVVCSSAEKLESFLVFCTLPSHLCAHNVGTLTHGTATCSGLGEKSHHHAAVAHHMAPC